MSFLECTDLDHGAPEVVPSSDLERVAPIAQGDNDMDLGPVQQPLSPVDNGRHSHRGTNAPDQVTRTTAPPTNI